MSINIHDIVALAKAGFTADQIARFNTSSQQLSSAPGVAFNPTQSLPNDTTQTQPTTPGATPYIPYTEAIQQTPQQYTVPVSNGYTPAMQGANMDHISKQLESLTTAIQSNAIRAASVETPKVESAEEILASVINPPPPTKGE